MQQKSSSLLAKLAIGVAAQYESANGLLNSLKDPQKVCGDFRKYVSNGVLFHQVTLNTHIYYVVHLLDTILILFYFYYSHLERSF